MTGTISRVISVDCRLVSAPWPWAEENRDAIQQHWRELTARSPAVFDGRVLVIRAGHNEGGVFRGEYIETAYSNFIAWNSWSWPDKTIRNGFSMAALRADDGAFVLGVMGGHTANAGKVYFPAGTPDLDDVRDGQVDLAGSVERELEEETGLGTSDVRFAPDFTVVEQGQRVAFLRETLIGGTGDQVAGRIRAWLAKQDEPELAGIHLVRSMADVDPERMPDFLVTYFQTVFSERTA